MFNTISHCTTVYYYYHVLQRIFDSTRPPNDAHPAVLNYLEFRPKFLTIWGLAIQFLLFALCVVHDVTRLFPASHPVRRAARSARDLTMAALAGPVAITVSAMFWGVFSVDRELVLPKALDAVVPAWLNHCMHTFIVVLAGVQLLAEPHYPPPLGVALALGFTLCGGYMYILFSEFAASGRWIYPVFEKLNWAGRGALVGIAFVLYLSLVIAFREAMRLRWGSSKAGSEATKKRKD